ncbi:MAG: cold shock domain-containing protein [Fibrobacter sp.]|nr:cold shock domain-containing protein [Fibrobacter sp.]
MYKGIIRLYNDINGCGFLERSDNLQLIKFTYKEIKRCGYKTVYEGQNVFFNIEFTKRGPLAVNIIPLEMD